MLDSEQKLWKHQEAGLEMPRQAFRKGFKRPIIVSPCGSGKSRIQREMARGAIDKGKRVLMMLHRRVLLNQVCQQFEEQGIDFGIIAAGHEENRIAPVQICMMQTVASKKKKVCFSMPKVDLVLVDEIHAQRSGQAGEIMNHYRDEGILQVGFTATPVSCKDVGDTLCVASNYSDMLECNAHLPVQAFGPDRPDLSAIRATSAEYTEKQCDSVIRVGTVFGRVYDHWLKYNPEALPAINFASSTSASKFWVSEFAKKGVCTASIDCKEITIAEQIVSDGKRIISLKNYPSDEQARTDLFEKHKSGEIKVIHNRFILREAWDAPYVYHCIITTPMRSVATYLQSVGRVLRYHDDYSQKIVQDHGGVIDNLDMPNIDREWSLEDTDTSIRQASIKNREKDKKSTEPICCPNCHQWRQNDVKKCPGCNDRRVRSVRVVREIDGTLKEVKGRVIKYKKQLTSEDIWKSSLWGAANTGSTIDTAIRRAAYRCKQKGIAWSPGNFTSLPLPPKRRHGELVTDVFPWTNKKRSKSFSQQ